MPHIVLLSESIGAGHDRAALAIEEALLSRYPNVRVTRLNLLDTFRPLTAKVTKILYLETLSRRPGLWGKWYEWQREKEMNGFSRLIVHSVLRKDVVAWLRRLAPDAVVCTHPLPSCMVAEMKRKGFHVPLCTVLTDFDLHGYWTHPGVDLYCVPVPKMANQLRQRIYGHSEVRVTGIPVSDSFANQLRNRPEPLRASGKQVLVMGGGLGIGVLPLVQEIVNSNSSNRITVVCGHNDSLRQQLEEQYAGHANLRILGFTREIAQLMASSDLLVTKPGGLTVSEALVMKLPMVVFSPIPGQELRNAQLMCELGVALGAQTEEEAGHQVRFLLENDLIRARMADRMKPLGRPFAAQEIADAVAERAERVEVKAQ